MGPPLGFALTAWAQLDLAVTAVSAWSNGTGLFGVTSEKGRRGDPPRLLRNQDQSPRMRDTLYSLTPRRTDGNRPAKWRGRPGGVFDGRRGFAVERSRRVLRVTRTRGVDGGGSHAGTEPPELVRTKWVFHGVGPRRITHPCGPCGALKVAAHAAIDFVDLVSAWARLAASPSLYWGGGAM